MNLIDTHCHLTFEGLIENLDSVLQRSSQAGVTSWVNVGTGTEDSIRAAALAEKNNDIYAAVGIHPHYAKDVIASDISELEKLAQHEKVVAIGETGLDFHYNFSKEDFQKRLFVQHLKIAEKFNLPVIVHSREAFKDTISILDQYAKKVKKIVFHCFGGSAEDAKIVLDKGYYISFTGVVTFKNAEKSRQAVQSVPLDRLMLETDCPYMSPVPVRNNKTNEPAFMAHTAKFIADLKQVPIDKFAEQATRTSQNFFNLPKK